MRKIYKWKLPIHGTAVVEYKGNTFDPLTIQIQELDPVLWAEVDEDGQVGREALVEACVTGGHAANGKYLGTVQIHHGLYVIHYYLIDKG